MPDERETKATADKKSIPKRAGMIKGISNKFRSIWDGVRTFIGKCGRAIGKIFEKHIFWIAVVCIIFTLAGHFLLWMNSPIIKFLDLNEEKIQYLEGILGVIGVTLSAYSIRQASQSSQESNITTNKLQDAIAALDIHIMQGFKEINGKLSTQKEIGTPQVEESTGGESPGAGGEGPATGGEDPGVNGEKPTAENHAGEQPEEQKVTWEYKGEESG